MCVCACLCTHMRVHTCMQELPGHDSVPAFLHRSFINIHIFFSVEERGEGRMGTFLWDFMIVMVVEGSPKETSL